MSGSMAPGPPVTGGRLGLCLRLGLVIAIGSIWVHSAPQGMPGTRRPGGGTLDCPICGSLSGKRPDGKYVCENNHVLTAKQAELAKAEAAEADAAQNEATSAKAAPAEAASAEATKSEG